MLQHRLAIWILLHETGSAEMPGSLKATGKSTYSRKQINGCKHQYQYVRTADMILPTTINKKYSGPILLSQFSLRLRRFHIFFIDFSLAVAARTIDIAFSEGDDRNISVAVTLVTYFHLYSPDPVIDHKFVSAAAFHNNVICRLTIYFIVLGKAFQS